MQGLPQQYNIQFATVEVEPPDMEVDTKPKVEKKTFAKKKKKAESESDDDTFDNKLEDNPAQVWPQILSTYICIQVQVRPVSQKKFALNKNRQ